MNRLTKQQNIGLQLDSAATEEEMADLFDKLKTACRRKEVDHMEEKKVTDSAPEKLEWTDSEIMDYAVQLFLDSLPSLDEKEENKSEKESPNKGISQEAINTLLDLSLTTEEALNKSAEITIREQDKPEGEVL